MPLCYFDKWYQLLDVLDAKLKKTEFFDGKYKKHIWQSILGYSRWLLTSASGFFGCRTFSEFLIIWNDPYVSRSRKCSLILKFTTLSWCMLWTLGFKCFFKCYDFCKISRWSYAVCCVLFLWTSLMVCSFGMNFVFCSKKHLTIRSICEQGTQ